MKLSLRIIALAIALLLGAPEAMAETRGKSLRRAERLIRDGNYEEAEKIYRRLLEQNGEDKEARLGLSFALIKRVQLQAAFEQAATVGAQDPLNGRAHSLMGTAMLRSGEFRLSVEAFWTALKFNNRDALAWAGLAESEYFENRTRNAYEGFKRAISIDALEPDYYVSLARSCSRLELYLEAADSYQRYLDVAPKTDAERRARIRGLIDFYRYLGTTKINRVSGPTVAQIAIEVNQYRPFLKVTINGKGPLRFVIDTGASLSVLSEQAAARLGVKPVARGGMARAVGGTGTFPILYGLLDSFEIGAIKIDAVPVYIRTVHFAPETPVDERADGYIGLSLLSNFALTLDYQGRTLKLDRTPVKEEDLSASRPLVPPVAPPVAPAEAPAPETPAASGGSIEIPIRSTSGGLASAETHLAALDRPFNFIIDTGATVTVISKAAVRRHQLEGLKLKGTTYRVIGAAGVEEGAEALALETLTVNGLRKRNARALILDLEPVNETSGFEQHGILGGDYLAHFLVELDLRRFRMRLTPQSPIITVAAEK